MAMNQLVIAIFVFSLGLASADENYSSQLLKGSVTCLDCPRGSDLSGIQVLVKCDKVKKLGVAYTEEDGRFETNLPIDEGNSAYPSNCLAKITGGPYQLYTSTKNYVSPIVEANKEDLYHFTTAKPLSFYKTCPSRGRCEANDMGFGSSKTVDLPLPREWGLAPSSYYIPFIPIIGIP